MNSPWSITFIKKNQLLITEKSGNLILADLKNQKLKKINHNLKVLVDGQGGLLEVLYSIAKFMFLILKTEEMVTQAHPLQLQILMKTF